MLDARLWLTNHVSTNDLLYDSDSELSFTSKRICFTLSPRLDRIGLCCFSVIVLVSLATLTYATYELFPSGKSLASFAASFASLSASSFSHVELYPGTQLFSTMVPACCRMLMADLMSLLVVL